MLLSFVLPLQFADPVSSRPYLSLGPVQVLVLLVQVPGCRTSTRDGVIRNAGMSLLGDNRKHKEFNVATVQLQESSMT